MQLLGFASFSMLKILKTKALKCYHLNKPFTSCVLPFLCTQVCSCLCESPLGCAAMKLLCCKQSMCAFDVKDAYIFEVEENMLINMAVVYFHFIDEC